MKRALAVVFLLMSLATVALADGSGDAPPPTMKPIKPAQSRMLIK
ncbi:MAG TPA: hypothetical protein VK722_16815 [Candidatus Aquilonibacter sp.]|jgi:hypothetical protein|nr:hypothetical protein [Candidatus Aquilonibacter sp.]